MEFFLALRGKGSAISSVDQNILGDWELKLGVPIDVVLDGIQEAFDRQLEKPLSLQECSRYINARFKKLRADSGAVEGSGNVSSGSSGSAAAPLQLVGAKRKSKPDAAPPVPTRRVDRALELLTRRNSAEKDADVRAAYALLLEEMREVSRTMDDLPQSLVRELDAFLAAALAQANPARFGHLPGCAATALQSALRADARVESLELEFLSLG